MSEQVKLEACPLCGGKGSGNGRITYSSNPNTCWLDGSEVLEEFYANCMSCGMRTAGFQTREQAVAAWNTRVPADDRAALMKAVEVQRAALQLAYESMAGNNNPFDADVWAQAVEAVIAALASTAPEAVQP